MGRKRSRKVEYLLLYLACGIMSTGFVQGCAYPAAWYLGRSYLNHAAKEAADGDFKSALTDNEKALKRYTDQIGDRALYQRGLFYVHPKNPGQDYTKAISAFTRLRKQFPESALNAEAEVWIVTLEAFIHKNNEIKHMTKENEAQRQSIDRLRNQISTQRQRLASQRQHIRELETQLEKMKNVDIGIERRKRKAGTQ